MGRHSSSMKRTLCWRTVRELSACNGSTRLRGRRTSDWSFRRMHRNYLRGIFEETIERYLPATVEQADLARRAVSGTDGSQ